MRRASQPDRVPVDIALAVLHFIPDGDNPYGIVAQLVGALAPGSYLVLSHATSDLIPENSSPTSPRAGSDRSGGLLRGRPNPLNGL
jgi:hypothetical protein